MSNNQSNHSKPTTTPVKIAEPTTTKFDVIAEVVAADAKRVRGAGQRMSSLVDDIAVNVHLAYSTGYVITERMAKADMPAGSVRQNDYVKMFAGRPGDDDQRGPSVTTIKRWRRCGAALAAGIEAKDALYKALKSDNVAQALAPVLDVAAPDEARIRKAYAKYVKDEARAKVAALEPGTAAEEDEQPSESRAAQVSTHEAKSAELIEALMAIVTGLKIESLTPAEFEAARGAYDVLGAKFDAYDEKHAATPAVKAV